MTKLLCSLVAAVSLFPCGAALAVPNTSLPLHSACHIDGVVVEGGTINGHIYALLRAPSGCGKGVRPTVQSWKIVVRDANGIRTFYRKNGSAMGQIKATGNAAMIWARFTIAAYGAAPMTAYGHGTLYLNQG